MYCLCVVLVIFTGLVSCVERVGIISKKLFSIVRVDQENLTKSDEELYFLDLMPYANVQIKYRTTGYI